jgi:hypothetical protein
MRIACRYNEVVKQPAYWQSWGSDSCVAEGSGLVGCEAVSLVEWILACRRVVVPSKRREMQVQRNSVTVQAQFSAWRVVIMKQVWRWYTVQHD